MDLVRLYLLGGLVTHKLVWELLKQRHAAPRQGAPAPPQQPVVAMLAKGTKTAILAGLLLQTVLPEIFPITTQPHLLRAVGLLIFTLGLAVAVLGRWQLGSNWSDIENAQILRGQQVVCSGIYRYIRHPIYAGDALLLLGFELSLNSWLLLGVSVLVPVIVWRALREERLLTGALPDYARYCAGTKRFVPFLI